MRKHYSRRASSEEKKNIRKAIFLTLLTIALIAGITVVGIPLVVRYAGFLTDINKSGTPITVEDETPPPPPKIDPLPESTSQSRLDISGSTEPGATVKISVNRDVRELLANKSGKFSLTTNLKNGENIIFATSIDSRGNESNKSETILVDFDKDPPELEIISPQDGSEFSGSSKKQVTIAGTTEEKARVTVNGKFVVVGSKGSFKFTTSLSEGDNKFVVKSTDKAENSTEVEINIRYSS